MEDNDSKEIDQPDLGLEVDMAESFQALSVCSTDPIKLFSVFPSDILRVNNSYICLSSQNTLTITKNSLDDKKSFTLASEIKQMEISKCFDLLVIQLDNLSLIFFDLDSELEIFSTSSSQPALLIKWNSWTANQLAVFWADEVLEVFIKPKDSNFTSSRFTIQGLQCFDFISSDKLLIQTADLSCKIISLEGGQSRSWEAPKQEKISKIVAFDSEKLAIVYSDSIIITDITNNLQLFSINAKQIFDYDPSCDYLYFNSPSSLQILIFSKSSFLQQKYQDAMANFTLMEACSSLTVRKNNDKPQAVARHGDDIFFYTFKPEPIEDPSLEIKSSPPSKRLNKFPQDSIKFEIKQINPKEITTPIISVMNKHFDEMIKKVEKGISPHSINNLVSKTIQSSLDQKVEGVPQKATVQSTVTQVLRYEFQTGLMPIIQQQISENFAKISGLFQESLRNSAEASNRAAAKAASLDIHMKSVIENIANTTSRLEKEYLVQLKKINEAEAKLNENLEHRWQEESIGQKSSDLRTDSLKREIDQKLKNHEFEAALLLVLREKNSGYLFSVLNVINPKIMCSSRLVSEGVLRQLFYELIESIEKDIEFKDIYIWAEELGKLLNLNANEVSKLLVRLIDVSEKKPRMIELVRIFSKKLPQ